jgi:hypothetical protein
MVLRTEALKSQRDCFYFRFMNLDFVLIHKIPNLKPKIILFIRVHRASVRKITNQFSLSLPICEK